MRDRVLVGLVALAACLAFAGCGKNDESASKRAGRAVGEAATDFASGIGQGVDNKMAVEVVLTADLAPLGVTKTVAKSLALSVERKGIAVYLISENKQTLNLIARALNKQGVEIGRSKVEASFEKADAKYVDFTFDKEMDSALVAKYEIGVLK